MFVGFVWTFLICLRSDRVSLDYGRGFASTGVLCGSVIGFLGSLRGLAIKEFMLCPPLYSMQECFSFHLTGFVEFC